MQALVRLVVGLALGLAFGEVAAAGTIEGRVVTPDNAPVADAVVFVQELPPGVTALAPDGLAIMDQVETQFVPHVLPVVVGTEVEFPNHDQIHHHVYSLSRARTFEIPLYKGETPPPVRFDTPGIVKLGCNIHDWMAGIILVVPTPYFATTDDTGAFQLDGLPAGTYPLAVWHERTTAPVDDTVQQVTVDGTPAAVTFVVPLRAGGKRLPVQGVRAYR